MTPTTGEPSFFELGVADPERGRAFYGTLFGWALEAGPAGRGFSIGTGGVPGGLHGGDAGASPYLFFRVDDLDAAVARVRELGGSVEDLGEQEEGEGGAESVARFGRFALCRDDQGSSFGLHEPPNGG
jgi:predicted enzyme related to lactoylglutathione lyase